MTPLPLPSQTLAWLIHAADAGQCDAQVMLHLIARADARDKDVAKFVDSYTSTIAALYRRLEALERGAKDLPAPEAPADDTPVADALLQAEAALADVAEGEAVSPHDVGCLHWAEARCTEALAVIRPVMRQHGIRTSEFPPAAPPPAAPDPVEPEIEVCETCDGEGTIDERLGGISTSNPAATCPDCDGVGEPRQLHRQAPAAPTPRPTALMEFVGYELPLLPGGKVDQVLTLAVIRKLAAWLDKQGDHFSGNCLRSHINR
jgi:hypothetical protein